MPILGGRLFDGHELLAGVLEVDEAGAILEVHEGEDTLEADVPGLAMAAPINAHTHLADRAARDQLDLSTATIEEAVAPPDGLKHRWLRQADEQALVASLRGGLAEAEAAGTAGVLDFREGGPAGARLARRAAEGQPVELTVLGRPTEPAAWEAEQGELLERVDGLGVSGLADQPTGVTEAQAAWCHEHGKVLALHHSEGRREDLAAALALEPDLLVHGTFWTEADLAAVADAGVGVVLCPRSNALFGNRPPVAELVEAGASLALGSDNAMFHRVDVWAEASAVLEGWPSVAPIEVLRMLSGAQLPCCGPAGLSPGRRAIVVDDAKGLRPAITHSRVSVPWRENLGRDI